MVIRSSYLHMGFPILGRCHLYIESTPWPFLSVDPDLTICYTQFVCSFLVFILNSNDPKLSFFLCLSEIYLSQFIVSECDNLLHSCFVNWINLLFKNNALRCSHIARFIPTSNMLFQQVIFFLLWVIFYSHKKYFSLESNILYPWVIILCLRVILLWVIFYSSG